VTATVPPGSTAVLHLPTGAVVHLTSGRHTFTA
jgi:hypothetical protein